MNQTFYDDTRAKQGWAKLPEALAQMGYESLRGPQEPCIKTIFGGQDVFCVLATGGGKTALAAIPTIVFEYRTVIFSPLIALMKDQVDSMNRRGIRAGAINSNQSDTENWHILQAWLRGTCRVLFVAPERISKPEFKTIMTQAPPHLVVVDEAHTMSQWGNNFRPSYVQCGEFVKTYAPQQVIALTATATNRVIEDVKRIMGTPEMVLERHYEERSNLKLFGTTLQNENDLFPQILLTARRVKGSVIVYCSTTKQVAALTNFLSQAGESVTFYHGQISDQSVKDMNQDTFMQNRARIMVATNAFGMGIDKPDIEAVIHASPPGSVEAISQEIGRAARDGREAICHTFASPSGYWMQEYLWGMSNPAANTIHRTLQYIQHHMDDKKEVRVTGEVIGEAIEDTSAPAALNQLVSLGCVERYASETKVATITVLSGEHVLSKPQTRVLSAVEQHGFRKAVSNEGNVVYQICLNFLQEKAGVSVDTIQKHLRQLHKDGVVLYEAPFHGKVTRFIREITDIELGEAAIRRQEEYNKIRAVREYINWPDKLKHQFLNDYFSLE